VDSGSGTGKCKCPTELTQGALTHQEVCKETGKRDGLEIVEAKRKQPGLRDQSFPHCLFLAGEDTSQQTENLNQLLSPQGARTSGNQGCNCREGLSLLFSSPLQTFTPTFTEWFFS